LEGFVIHLRCLYLPHFSKTPGNPNPAFLLASPDNKRAARVIARELKAKARHQQGSPRDFVTRGFFVLRKVL
jgi:hypothetical protein